MTLGTAEVNDEVPGSAYLQCERACQGARRLRIEGEVGMGRDGIGAQARLCSNATGEFGVVLGDDGYVEWLSYDRRILKEVHNYRVRASSERLTKSGLPSGQSYFRRYHEANQQCQRE